MLSGENATPRFEIIRSVAQFDDRDCIVGWRRRRVAVTETAAWAFKLLEREDQDHDLQHEVRDISTGKRVWRQFAPADTGLDAQAFTERRAAPRREA